MSLLRKYKLKCLGIDVDEKTLILFNKLEHAFLSLEVSNSFYAEISMMLYDKAYKNDDIVIFRYSKIEKNVSFEYFDYDILKMLESKYSINEFRNLLKTMISSHYSIEIETLYFP